MPNGVILMVFENTYKLSDILSVISIILAIVGGVFAYYQWCRNISLKRASYINELTEKIRSDPDIKDIVYLFDYNQNWYSEQFHDDDSLELKVDKTLSYFSYICYLKKRKIISKKEFYFFQYEVERILMNFGTQDYFYNLYHFAGKFKTPFTFVYLLDYGKENHLLDRDFFDKESYKTNYKYHHYLNF